MFEAYKVSVRMTLIDGVTAGVLGIARTFNTAHTEATLLQNRLDKLKLPALFSGALAGVGVAGLSLLKTPLDEAEKYQNILGKLAAQGIGDNALRQADKFAKGMNIIGASNSDTLKMVAEANSVLRNMSESQAVAPMLLRMKFGIESVMNAEGRGAGHGEKAERMFMDALKTTELRGALIDPATQQFSEERFKNQLDFMTKAYTASGGLVKPTEYLNMIKTGGIAAKSLSDNAFYFGLLHMAQESGGSRVGTSLMSAFQNIYMGRTTQQVAEQMKQDHLLDASMIHYGKTGHITKIDPAALKNAELFRIDQFAYMNQVMLPMLRAQGVQDGAQMEIGISKLFSNRTASNLWTTMYKERANIQKHIDAAKGAMGVDALAAQGDTQLSGKRIQLHAKMDKLMLALGENILPMAVRMLEHLNPLLERLNGFMREHGTLVKGVVVGFAGLAVAATVAGSLGLVGVALNGLQLVLGSGVMGVGLRGIGMGIAFLGRALLMNPIGLAVTGITLALWGFYTYWDKIKDGFDGFLGLLGFGDAAKRHANNLYTDKQRSDYLASDDYKERHKNDYIRTAQQQQITVQSPIHLDGRLIAQVVTTHQGFMADLPQVGGSGFDGRMGMASPVLAGMGG